MVLDNLQELIQTVPESSHSTRQILLIADDLVMKDKDDIIDDYYQSKFAFYSNVLKESSQTFEVIQKDMQTDLKEKVSFDSYMIKINDVQTDSSIKSFT